MMTTLALSLSFAFSFVQATLIFAADETTATKANASPAGASPTDVDTLAARIDAHLDAAWKRGNIEPAPPADDSEYMRRTYLNIAGRIPPVFEVRKFLADSSPEKRRQLVDRLLEGPAFIGHMTNVYRAMMIPEADADFQLLSLVPPFESWLREKLLDDTGYDTMVRELVTAPVAVADNSGPVAFFRAKGAKPENLAAGTSRLFLGVRLECAQCHDHPFAKWKREQFWSLAAFYAGVEGEQFGPLRDSTKKHDLKIPETEKTVEASFLNGQSPQWNSETEARDTLGDWLTSAENPYFARAAANRLWAQMMGVGIVNPVDDFDESNPPSHPELLDDLARAFAASGFDVKYLLKSIAASRAYQFSSRQTHASQEDPHQFARMSVKGLTAEQLYDSLGQATGFYDNVDFNNRRFFFQEADNPRGTIKQLFGSGDAPPTEIQTSILQALALMNGRFISSQTHPVDSSTLAAVIDSPFLDMPAKIETLYLAALSRKPTEVEMRRMLAYVAPDSTTSTSPVSEQDPKRVAIESEIRALLPNKDGSPTSNPRDVALGDIFWALLNSSEFIFNH
jgi:hypothetical protein